MIDARAAANRFRLLAMIALVTALALASFWVREVMRRGMDDSLQALPRSEPDYYVEKFNFIKISKTGQAQYSIAGVRLTHNPADDSYEIQKPVVNSLSKERPPMTMHAERAIVDGDSSKVHMYKNVHIDRQPSGDSEHLHIASEYLLLLPDDDVMSTPKPVHILLGSSILTGTGMLANNATRQLDISSNAHVTYQSGPPAAPR